VGVLHPQPSLFLKQIQQINKDTKPYNIHESINASILVIDCVFEFFEMMQPCIGN